MGEASVLSLEITRKNYTNEAFDLILRSLFSMLICNVTIFYCSTDVNYEELARCTDDFNGAQCKAVCVEAVS